MSLKKYFEDNRGTGVLATADKNGKVNTAIYASPHVLDDSTIAFIMRDRLSRKNLLENPSANYLFQIRGEAVKGARLQLKMASESTDPELISSLSRRNTKNEALSSDVPRFLVTFSVEKCLALVGGDELSL